MGCFGSSKSNKVAPQVDPEPKKCSSAPSSIEVEKDWPKEAAPRQLSDDGTRTVEEGAASGGQNSSQSPVGVQNRRALSQLQRAVGSAGSAKDLRCTLAYPMTF